DCETAYAKDPNSSSCFIEDGFGNWGWTNQFETEGVYELDLYAGAGQCDLNSGELVGNVTVDYTDGFVTVTYNIFEGYVMNEAQVYIGCSPYPSNNGSSTVAP